MTAISAQAVLVSRNIADPYPNRNLATFLLEMPRCILAKFNTHRAFSRNAASSRAIPVAKMIDRVVADPFIPLVWGKNQKGMQAQEECRAPVLTSPTSATSGCTRECAWLYARDAAVKWARAFSNAGYHKQIVNRLLEPWMWTKVVVKELW